MSRLIVKNLPKNITEDKLRSIFSEKGTITDVQLKYTPEGKFRQFAFVGYQNEDDAENALKYFDKMCINTNKLGVERCTLLGDLNKRKAWSKYATGLHGDETKNISNVKDAVTKTKKKEKTDLLEKYKSDPMFKEFMQVHAPNEVQLLERDEPRKETEEDNKDAASDSESSKVEQNKLALKEISDSEYMKELIKETKGSSDSTKKTKEKKKIELFTVKLRDLPYSCKKKDIKHFFHPLVPFTIRLPRKIKGIAYVGFKTEKHMNKALIKNKSFISGKRIFVIKYENKTSQVKDDSRKSKWKVQEELVKNEESIAESGRIFLRNLPYTATEKEIQDQFSKFGPIAEVNLPVDSVTRKIKGFGIITFLMPEHAVKAYSELDGTIFQGRMLHLLPGKAKDVTGEDVQETSNYKKKKIAKQKEQSGQSHNWNSLFLGHDAVAEVIANTYGVSKDNVLAPHGDGSAAVRLALGETQIVASTRKYLEQEGVVLDAFSLTNVKRSNTIILVKNLPKQTPAVEIRRLFEKFGVVGRVILPPSGITAVVEFLEPSEARKAFISLAYSKFKNVPLYLEWAPENSLMEMRSSHVEVKQTEPKQDEAVDDEEPEDNTTLFVKNLHFETTDESLKKHFQSCGKIHYAKVALKKDKSNGNKKLSMGFGFVQFKTKEGADKALKTLQQTSLDGKNLELKRSERTLKQEATTAKTSAKPTKQTGTKILVRNVPFQANKKEIGELFSTFGEMKALRMPKKMATDSTQHRGFAFIDYVSASDAKSAFEALCQSTHLYGRRLVLEWASVKEDVTEIRKRTAQHFKQATEQPKSKKSVADLNI